MSTGDWDGREKAPVTAIDLCTTCIVCAESAESESSTRTCINACIIITLG